MIMMYEGGFLVGRSYQLFLICKCRHSEHWSERIYTCIWKIMLTLFDQLPIKHPAPRGGHVDVFTR